jgi:hypothetical protein
LVSSHVSDEDQIGVTELQMSNPERDAIRALAPATELVSFDVAAHDALVREATRLGITAEEYIHDAAVAQVALARQARGEDADGLVAGWARVLRGQAVGHHRLAERQIGALARAKAARGDAVALSAQSQQARRHAAEVAGDGSLLLDAVVLLLTEFLRRQGIALLEPVAARFRGGGDGSTGVAVTVRLEDPSYADAVKAALVERYPDRLSEVTVS